jgi:hypothetical protein
MIVDSQSKRKKVFCVDITLSQKSFSTKHLYLFFEIGKNQYLTKKSLFSIHLDFKGKKRLSLKKRMSAAS